MKRIRAIGVGAGGIDLLTVQAIEALRATDVFFIFDKGEEKAELANLRKAICARYCTERPYRFAILPSPPRGASLSYKSGVDAWHAERARAVAEAIDETLREGETGAFLVWGDPALYDSTLRILDAVAAAGCGIHYDVIPGISSIQLLAARHRIALNTIGDPVLITTGRRLASAFPEAHTSVVVFLDNGEGLRSLAGREAHIYWGAYLGTDDEVLAEGEVAGVLEHILVVREARRRAKGWIMDVYLVRVPPAAPLQNGSVGA